MIGVRRRTSSPMQAGWGSYAIILTLTVIAVFPLYYTIVMASHTNAEMAAATPPMLPTTDIFDNLKKAFELAPLNHGLVNSIIVSTSVTLGTVAFCTLAGFAFAKLNFRARNLLLGLCIATMMVPMQMGVIPLYMMMARLGLTGHLQAVILPTLVTAFGVFFVPGTSRGRAGHLLTRRTRTAPTRSRPSYVVVPAARPAMAVLGAHVRRRERLLWPIPLSCRTRPSRSRSRVGDQLARNIHHHGRHLCGTVPV